MPDERIITHPQHGTGKLLRTLKGGYLWEVLFQSGRKFTLPYHQFENAHMEVSPHESHLVAPRESPDTDQFRNRQTLEALRFGVVPVKTAVDLTIGLETERENMKRALARTMELGGDTMAIIADYGFGKSHFIELTAQTALERNFLVASTSLDLIEVPPGKAREIYRALVNSIRYPKQQETGLRPLIQLALSKPAAIDQLTSRKPIEDCPLCAALNALNGCASQAAFDDLINWLSAQIKPTSEMKHCLKKPPTLYAVGEVARQYAYLLTAISELAVLVGYAGLAVLIDESEHYSLLRPAQKDRADSFFKAMVIASEMNTGRINPDQIPNHTRADYPIKFSRESHLFFMFASTESDERMPIESWLTPTQIVRLDDRFLKDDIEKFLKMVLRYHSVAYQYKASKERYATLILNISAMLSRTLSQHRINIRELIRYVVTVCDLMFLHADYLPTEIEGELKTGLGM